MIRVVRAMGLGVSSASIAHTCPAYGLPAMLGQWISASSTCSRRPASGWPGGLGRTIARGAGRRPRT
jgi:hypothetical protein